MNNQISLLDIRGLWCVLLIFIAFLISTAVSTYFIPDYFGIIEVRLDWDILFPILVSAAAVGVVFFDMLPIFKISVNLLNSYAEMSAFLAGIIIFIRSALLAFFILLFWGLIFYGVFEIYSLLEEVIYFLVSLGGYLKGG